MKTYELPKIYRLNLNAFELGELMGAISLLSKTRPEFAAKFGKKLSKAWELVEDRRTYPGVRQLERVEKETTRQ